MPPRRTRRLWIGLLASTLLAAILLVLALRDLPPPGPGTEPPGRGEPSPRGIASPQPAPRILGLPRGTPPPPGTLGDDRARPAGLPAGPAAAAVSGGELAGALAGPPAASGLLVRFLDLRRGTPIPGARLHLAAYHGPGSLATAGTPALHSELLACDEDGTAAVAPLLPEDPLLRLHLQVLEPGYYPAALVLEGRDGAGGLWRRISRPDGDPSRAALHPRAAEAGAELELHLRPLHTVAVEILDPRGKPLSLAPVAVTPWGDGHAFLEKAPVEIAPSGRLAAPGETRVLFTDPAGRLHLPLGGLPWDLELLDPAASLVHFDHDRQEEVLGRVTVEIPLEGPLRLATVASWLEAHLLLDAGDLPIARAEVEIALEGMAPRRAFTDEHGWFTATLAPHDPRRSVLSHPLPRRGTVTVVSPDFARRGAAVALPSRREEVILPARPAGRLTFRCVRHEPPGEPLRPEALQISADLTPVRMEAGGRVVLRGSLPPSGSEIEIFTSGFLPARVALPDRPPGAGEVDLGEIAFREGERRELHVTGVPAPRLLGAELLLERADRRGQVHRFAVAAPGRAVATGLWPGSYLAAVESPAIDPEPVPVEVHEDDDAPVEIRLREIRTETVTVRGRVRDLSPAAAVQAQVVERYFLAAGGDPVAMAPYPLSPDGSFSSVRTLRPVRAVQVSVVSPGESAAEASLARDLPEEATAGGASGQALFDLGELWMRRQPHAEVTFEAEGLGGVAPPLQVSLAGQEGVEAIARLSLRRRRLLLHNLRPGPYALEWREAGGATSVLGFEVPRAAGLETELVARREPAGEEAIEVRAVDSRGAPILEARAEPAAPVFHPALLPGEPGVVLVAVRPRGRTEFSLAAPGYLPARVEVAPGGVVPRLVTLYRGARARGRVLDADGLEVTGEVEIDWEPLAPGPVRHGTPLRLHVEGGRLRAEGLPPLTSRLRVRLAGTGAEWRRTVTLAEVEHEQDLGVLELVETRTLRGIVFLADGGPAAGALVALVARSRAHLYPLQEPLDPARLPHRARTDGQGRFLLDGLPLAPAADQVLMARLEGAGAAVEDPLGWDSETHDLVLELQAALDLDVGYLSGGAEPRYRFTLEYRGSPGDAEGVELGEIVPDLFGLHRYGEVRPGAYRVEWSLRDAYAPLPGLWEDIFVPPGAAGHLRLRIDDRRALRGRALWNGEILERGWVLLTADPGLQGSTRVGRILDGEFVIPDPPAGFRAYAALVPEAAPQPLQNPARGEALPVAVRDYRAASREGWLEIDYRAYHLTLRFAPEFLARHPGCLLGFDGRRWDGSRFEVVPFVEPLEEPAARFHLLAPGPYGFTVRNQRGSLIARRIVMLRDRDLELWIR